MGRSQSQARVRRASIIAATLVLTLFAWGSGTAWADYGAGLTAYQRGDFAAAIAAWKPLADQGDAKAQLGLGILYDSGHGVPQNAEEAGRWYGLAADRGNVAALYNLGRLFTEGRGVPVDFERARRLWQLAADNGSAPAAHNIGVMNYTGIGVPQNLQEAARWFQRAADQGYPESQFMLGEMNRLGIGVPQDVANGMRLLSVAELQGNARAAQTLRMLAVTPSAPVKSQTTPPTLMPASPGAAQPPVATAAAAQARVPMPAPVAPPAAPALAAAPASAAAPAASVGVALWIASFSAEDLARKQWSGLQAQNMDLLARLRPRLVPVSRDGRVFWRLMAEGFSSKAEADQVCQALQQRRALSFCQTVDG